MCVCVWEYTLLQKCICAGICFCKCNLVHKPLCLCVQHDDT